MTTVDEHIISSIPNGFSRLRWMRSRSLIGNYQSRFDLDRIEMVSKSKRMNESSVARWVCLLTSLCFAHLPRHCCLA